MKQGQRIGIQRLANLHDIPRNAPDHKPSNEVGQSICAQGLTAHEFCTVKMIANFGTFFVARATRDLPHRRCLNADAQKAAAVRSKHAAPPFRRMLRQIDPGLNF
ncbi:hypothetical protein [uncultured Roseobacter sp.]|uniref:hypothetical protein n=1 Tax=uncultured Roseobacter sp. TaxID=114847 RepID=UPI002622C408|nr:hypothetical protein [uncultured Roseobacter sp.]